MDSFDTSDEEESGSENIEPTDTFHLDWLEIPSLGLCHCLALSALPGARFKEDRRNLKEDIEVIVNAGITDVFVLMKPSEFRRYKVPNLLQEYEKFGMQVHHCKVEDGSLPEEQEMLDLILDLRTIMQCNGKSLIHCFGGFGRTGVLAACFLMSLDPSMSAEAAIGHVRSLRGSRAIQTVRQWNFVQDFRTVEKNFIDDKDGKYFDRSRSVSR